MNFYQLGYYRTGKQGSDAGWKLAAASKGLDYDAINGFKGIAANLVELKKTLEVPSRTLGVFQYERFVYIIHVNFAAQGTDARGVAYVHGYCFTLKDYYELCISPEKLLGIREENYVKEYDSSIKEYPVRQELSYDSMDYGNLIKKYGFSNEEYSQMVVGAISAVEGLAMPLCIKYTLPQDEYKQAYKEIMYLIMKGMPYHLRTKLTGYSYKGGRTVVYFSDTAEGKNYIDLDSRTFACSQPEMKHYEFAKGLFSVQEDQRNTIFRNMAKVMEDVFENALYDNNINKVEACFQRMKLKNISPEKAAGLLEYMLGCRLTENKETYLYLETLLKAVNKGGLLITDKDVLGQLNARYERCDNNEFKREVCLLNARLLLHGDKKEGFKTLLGLSRDFPEQYDMLCSALETQDKEFYREYYTEAYLPEYLHSLDAVPEYLKSNKNLGKDEYCSVLSIVSELTKKEFEKAYSFRQLDEIETIVEEILEFIPDSLMHYKMKFGTKMSFGLWDSFDPDRFEPKEIEMYRHCDVEAIAKAKLNGEPCRSAQRVLALIRLFEEDITRNGREYLIKTLFTDEFLSGTGAKDRIRNLLREERLFECDLSSTESFDYSLALVYGLSTERFDTLGWIRGVEIKEPLEAHKVERYIIGSRLLNMDGMEEKLVQSLEEDIRKEKKSRSGKLGKEQIESLKLLYCCLKGEAEEAGEDETGTEEEPETETGDQATEGEGFSCALHKVPVGLFALSAIAYWAWCLKNYMDLGPVLFYMIVCILAVTGAGAGVVKIIQSGGMGNLLRDLGFHSMANLLVYTGVFLAMAGGIAAVYFLPGIKAKMAGIFVLSLVSAVSAILYGIHKKARKLQVVGNMED